MKKIRLVWQIILILKISILSKAFDELDDTGKDCLAPDMFQKLAPNSKYLIHHNRTPTVGYEQTSQICKAAGLEVAVVDSQEDLYHLEQGFFDNDLMEYKFALGIKYDEEFGFYMAEGNSSIPISFQAFEAEPGSNKPPVPVIALPKYCVMLKSIYEDNFYLVMEEAPCIGPFFTLCQFPKSSKCNTMSPSSLAALQPGLEYIGSTLQRSYFMGNLQSTFGAALEDCHARTFNLLDFEMEGRESQELFKMLKLWQKRTGVFDNTAFWTSGHHTDDVMDGLFKWMTTETMFDPKNTTVPWQWDHGEPNDNMDSNNEECVTFAVPTTVQKESMSNVLFRLSNCRMPYYYVCYRNDIGSGGGDDDQTDDYDSSETDDATGEPCVMQEIPKLNLSKASFGPEEILALAELNMKYNFAGGRAEVTLPEDPSMELKFIKTLAVIARKTCEDPYVPHAFINVMKTLIMMYMLNIRHKIKDTTGNNEKWKDIVQSLEDCSKTIMKNPFSFDLLGDYIVGINGSMVVVPAEILDNSDKYPRLDLIIESFWFMFQISAAACYPKMQQTQWQVDYFTIFKKRFVDVLADRWLPVKYELVEDINYGSFIGDIDITSALYNLRVCAAAAHMNVDILDRLFARPLLLQNDHGIDFENVKIDDELNPMLYYSKK